MKKKLLYVSHVDWNWIKQRPQYIAEQLAEDFQITIICPHNYRIKTKNEKGDLDIRQFHQIPFIDRNKTFSVINDIGRKIFYKKIVDEVRPEIIYITHPVKLKYIPENYNGYIIYDCMDDMLAFENAKFEAERIKNYEKEIIHRSSITLVSSENLKNKLVGRYGTQYQEKMILIRNGYNSQDFVEYKHKESNDQNYKICYFGTISQWFNFEFLLKSLEEIADLEYVLIGPIEKGTEIPKHERLKYIGTVQHDELVKVTEEYDAFIMPFVLNELIESVDPVKLYEYINLNKNILCIEYNEIKRFEDFVYFYKDYVSFILQVKNMKESGRIKYDKNQREQFLTTNTWEMRGKKIKELIKTYLI